MLRIRDLHLIKYVNIRVSLLILFCCLSEEIADREGEVKPKNTADMPVQCQSSCIPNFKSRIKSVLVL